MTVGSGLYSHRRLMSVSSAISGSSSTLRALALFLSLLSSRRRTRTPIEFIDLRRSGHKISAIAVASRA